MTHIIMLHYKTAHVSPTHIMQPLPPPPLLPARMPSLEEPSASNAAAAGALRSTLTHVSMMYYSTCVIIIRAQTSPHHQMIRRHCRHPHHTARKCNRTRNTSKSAALWLRLSASSAQYPDRDPSTEGIRPRGGCRASESCFRCDQDNHPVAGQIRRRCTKPSSRSRLLHLAGFIDRGRSI